MTDYTCTCIYLHILTSGPKGHLWPRELWFSIIHVHSCEKHTRGQYGLALGQLHAHVNLYEHIVYPTANKVIHQ